QVTESVPFKSLCRAGVKANRDLETFQVPEALSIVRCFSDEVTAVCPVTGQPDWYKVEIEYIPRKLCVESKSLKLYLQSFREVGVFGEALASQISCDVAKALNPYKITTTVVQKSRGGITIESESTL